MSRWWPWPWRRRAGTTPAAPAPMPGALVGLADLARIRALDDPALLAAAAELLDRRRAPAPRTVVTQITETFRLRDRVEATVHKRPADKTRSDPLPALHVWAATELVATAEPPAEPIASPSTGEPTNPPGTLPRWTDRPPPACYTPLATWPALLPRLRRSLTACAPTHSLDLPRLIHRLSRGERAGRLRYRPGRRWGADLHLISDHARRLVPYWTDQALAAAWVAGCFPRHGVVRGVIDDGLRPPWPAWAGASAMARPGPPAPAPGSAVLVLGDLGVLACDGAAVRHFWRRLGQAVRAAGARAVAIVPFAPAEAPADLRGVWTRIPWERSPTPLGAAGRAAQAERLLAALALSVRVEPGLLRDLRRLLGLAAAAEAELWQHPALTSPSSVAATLDPQVLRDRRAAFDALPARLRAQVWARQRGWRAHLPAAVLVSEAAQLTAASEDLLSAAERDLLAGFFVALEAGLATGAAPTGALAWFQRLEQRARMDEPIWQRQAVGRLWAAVHANDPGATPPPGFDPAALPADPSAVDVTLMLSQRGGMLCAEPRASGTGQPERADAMAPAGPLGWLTSRNRWLRVQPVADADPPAVMPDRPPAQATARRLPAGEGLRIALPEAAALLLSTDREQLTLHRLSRPAWASAMGRDQHGLWVEFTIPPPKRTGEPVTQRLRWCPPGRFQMGSPPDEPGRWDDEGPRHAVCIGQGFWLFDTPCTQALWEAVMGENPSRFQDPRRPVENVDWNQVQGLIARINQRLPGLGLSLPSEAQWEHACRAGSETALYSGPIKIVGERNAPALDPIAWYGGNSKGETHPVGLKLPNAWGLYDMLGNVWEWTADHWHDDYQGAPTDGRPWLDADADDGVGRVVRGGSWSLEARFCRCAYRIRRLPGPRNDFRGFRCARVQAV